MGPLGSQASTEQKKVVNSEQLFRAVFSCFHGQKFNLKKIHCIVLTKKLLDTKVIFFLNWEVFWGDKNCF